MELPQAPPVVLLNAWYPKILAENYVQIVADAYTTSDIIYKWDQIAITIDSDASNALPNFRISAFRNKSCDSITNTGVF